VWGIACSIINVKSKDEDNKPVITGKASGSRENSAAFWRTNPRSHVVADFLLTLIANTKMAGHYYRGEARRRRLSGYQSSHPTLRTRRHYAYDPVARPIAASMLIVMVDVKCKDMHHWTPMAREHRTIVDLLAFYPLVAACHEHGVARAGPVKFFRLEFSRFSNSGLRCTRLFYSV
jgi:hypothetical protein